MLRISMVWHGIIFLRIEQINDMVWHAIAMVWHSMTSHKFILFGIN